MSLPELPPRIVEIAMTGRDERGDEWCSVYHAEPGGVGLTATIEERPMHEFQRAPEWGHLPALIVPRPRRRYTVTIEDVHHAEHRVPVGALQLDRLTTDELAVVLDPGAVGW